MARKRSSSSSVSGSLSELRERAALLERIAKAEERIAGAKERQARAEERIARSQAEYVRRPPGQARATTGQYLPKKAPPPKEEPKPAQVVNWLVKTRIVTDRTPDDEDYDYADYSLWVVVNFDPQKNEKKMEDVLKQYRAWLQRKDPHVKWLSPKWDVSRTTSPPSARIVKEPPRPSGK